MKALGWLFASAVLVGQVVLAQVDVPLASSFILSTPPNSIIAPRRASRGVIPLLTFSAICRSR